MSKQIDEMKRAMDEDLSNKETLSMIQQFHLENSGQRSNEMQNTGT